MRTFLLLCALLAATTAIAMRPDPNGVLCTLCTDLMQEVESAVEADGEADIIKKANAACDKITGNNPILDPACKAIVDTDIKKVEEDIKNKVAPKQICAKLSLC
uniref:Saposin B-type domain-containing protein n=1 Tax=Steinernema glaseri TaxID=37863 RepID=A0A1I8ATX9_9BILA